MAFLARALKAELIYLATEMGAEVPENPKVVQLRKIILGSPEYEEELVKDMLEVFRAEAHRAEERRMRELELQVELERARVQNVTVETVAGRDLQSPGNDDRFNSHVDFHKLMPQFTSQENDISLYLVLFERQAGLLKVRDQDLVSHLLKLLPHDVLEVIAREPASLAHDYVHIKKLLLEKYRLSPEKLRLMFYNTWKQPNLSWKDYIYNLGVHYRGWIDGMEVTTLEQLIELSICEQAKRRVPNDIREHYLDKWSKLKTTTELAELLDNYETAREDMKGRRPDIKFRNGYLPDHRGRNFGKSLEKKGSKPTQEQSDRRNGRPGVSNQEAANIDIKKREAFEKRVERRCYVCASPDHLKPDCPVGRKNAEQRTQVNRVISAGIREQLAPYMQDGFVNGHEIPILRDTGASIDIVARKYVTPEMFNGNQVWLQTPLHLDPVCLPIAEVELVGDFGKIYTQAAVVQQELDQKIYILGNKTASLINDQWERNRPIENVNMVVTRAMAQRVAREQEIEALVSKKELEIAQLSENVRKLNEINNENKSTILLLQKELIEVSESYSSECDSLKKEIENTRGVFIEKETQIHSLHKAIESKTCDFDLKLAELEKVTNALQLSNDEIDEKQKCIDQLENQLQDLLLKNESLKNNVESKDEKLQEQEIKLCNLQEEVTRKEELLLEKTAEITKLLSALKVKEKSCCEKEEKIISLEKQLIANKENFNTLRKEIDDKHAKILELERMCCCKEKELEVKEKHLYEKENELKRFSESLELVNEVSSGRQKTIQMLQDRINSLCTENESLKSNIEDSNNIISRERSNVSNLRNEIAEKNLLLAQKEEEIATLSQEVKDLEREKFEKNEIITFLQDEMKLVKDTLGSKCDSLIEQIQNNETELCRKEESLSVLENKILCKEEELCFKINELVKVSKSIDELSIENKEKQEMINSLEEKLINTLQQLQEVQKSCEMEKENLKRDIEGKEILLKEKTEREQDLEKELAAKDRTLVEKVEAIAVLSNKIESMNQSMQNSIEKQDCILILLEEQKQLHNSLTVENEELKRTLVKNEACLLDKDGQISKYVGKIEILEKEINDKKDAVINLLNKITLLDEELSQKQETIHNLKELIALLDKIKSENELLKNQKIEVETKLLNFEKNTDELSNKCQEMELQLLEKKKEIDDLQIQLQEHNSRQLEISNLKEKLKNLEVVKAKYTELKVKYLEVVKECQNMKSLYDGKLAKLKEQMLEFNNKNLEEVKSQHSSSTAKTVMNLNLLKEKYSQCHGDNVELRRQLWELKENLLSATNENKKLRARLSVTSSHSQALGELEQQVADRRVSQYRRASERHPQIGIMDVIEESVTYTRRRTRSSETPIPPGFGQAFPPQDEQGEEFNAKYLDDMMEGRCIVDASGTNRLTEFQHRNSMVLPHLKSSYPVIESRELLEATEDDVKFGHVGDGDNFDTLSTSCLLPDKRKNKDRGQTSYKKPGPPTPGKNGGRLSQQGLEQRTTPHSILREQNDNSLSRKGLTPNRLKMFFSSKTSRKDENSPVTPRTRGLGFFKKTIKSRNHPF